MRLAELLPSFSARETQPSVGTLCLYGRRSLRGRRPHYRLFAEPVVGSGFSRNCQSLVQGDVEYEKRRTAVRSNSNVASCGEPPHRHGGRYQQPLDHK